ncbi:MAG: EcsC family protein [Candidatus Acidiferrales bacterium]
MLGKRNRTKRSGLIGRAVMAGLGRTYSGFGVKPEKFLAHIQTAHRLPIQSFEEMFLQRMDFVDSIADKTIRSSKRLALLEGAGVGLGGFMTLVPDVSLLAAIAMRMLQKLSLIYGFEYTTPAESAELWVAAATAAGVDLGRDFVQKEVVERFVPRVMERIALRIGAESAEKWAARAIPLASGAIGGGLNYLFIREWGRRAKKHFREQHLLRRQSYYRVPPVVGAVPTATLRHRFSD